MELIELTSWALVGLAGTSHCAARAEFASRYDKFVRRVLAKRWLGSPYRIYFDDAIQEVFVECFKSGGVIAKANPEQGASFRTLLFRVTTHVAARFERNHFRDSQTVSVDDANLESLHDDESAFAQITREEVAVVVVQRSCM